MALVAGRVARADSDGYACIGPDYVAIEFRAFNTKGITGPHVVRIARFDATGGPRWAGEVVLEEFQTHSFACGARTILIDGAGEGGRGLVSYTIHIDSTGSARIALQTSDPQYGFRQFPADPINLGNWARPGIIQLPSRGTYPKFQLHVTEATVRVDATAMMHNMKTVLEEVDASGALHRSLTMSEGGRLETGG